jgi:hypothetical protein
MVTQRIALRCAGFGKGLGISRIGLNPTGSGTDDPDQQAA